MKQYQNANQKMDYSHEMARQAQGMQTITVSHWQYDRLVAQANLCADAVAALQLALATTHFAENCLCADCERNRSIIQRARSL